MEKIHTSPASHCGKYDGEVIGLMLAIMTTITVFDHTYSSKSVHSTLTRKSGIDVVFAHTNCDSTLIAWVWVHTTKTNFIYFMCLRGQIQVRFSRVYEWRVHSNHSLTWRYWKSLSIKKSHFDIVDHVDLHFFRDWTPKTNHVAICCLLAIFCAVVLERVRTEKLSKTCQLG